MFPHMSKALEIFLSKIESRCRNDESFDIYEMFSGLTLDIISRTAFGMETNVQTNPRDPFLLDANELLKEGPFSGLDFVATCFPEFKFIIGYLVKWTAIVKYHLSNNHVVSIQKSCLDMIRSRRADPNNRREDFLQLLIDAEINTNLSDVSNDSLTASHGAESRTTEENSPTIKVPSRKKEKTMTLTEIEVASNALTFIVGGTETGSATLGYAAYVLVKHPEIQQKLREEILKVQAEDGSIDNASLSKLKYMEMVLFEVLRLYPPGPIQSNAAALYGNLRIPKDISIIINAEIIHQDPDYWPDPEKFIPERFAPENRHNLNSSAFQTFGGGPRNCVGMRFFFMEAKLTLARLLSQYRLVPRDNTEIVELEVKFKSAVIIPKNGVFVKAEKI